MKSLFFQEYFPILIFFGVGTGLACVIFGASYFFAIHKPDTEKLSAYECGFDPYEDARQAFDVRFYLVAMLFIIFDLEAMYLFPLAVSFSQVGPIGFWILIDFFVELVVGFYYAWQIGALEWH